MLPDKTDVGSETFHPVVDIGYKLTRLSKIAGISTYILINDLKRFYGVSDRTTGLWLGKSRVGIKSKGRHAIIDYFTSRHRLNIDDRIFSLSRDEFDALCENLPPSLKQAGLVNSGPSFAIDFPDAPQSILDKDRRYICGFYDMFRFSFSGEKKIAVECLQISEIPGVDNKCRVEMYCHPVNKDVSGDYEIFIGSIFRYGQSYNIIASYSDNNSDRRMRFLQFPVLAAIRPRHFGMMMGYSANFEEPVAARVIITKVGTASFSSEDLQRVRRVDPDDSSVATYAAILQSEPRPDISWMITTDKRQLIRPPPESQRQGTPGSRRR